MEEGRKEERKKEKKKERKKWAHTNRLVKIHTTCLFWFSFWFGKMRLFKKHCIIISILGIISCSIIMTLKAHGILFSSQWYLEERNFNPLDIYDLQIEYLIENSTEISSIEENIRAFKSDLPKETISLSNEITVLTAYFNIGAFPKGAFTHQYTPNIYYKWMSVFGNMTNGVIFYTNDMLAYKFFQKLRENFPKERTKLFLINKNELWSFKIQENISQIYAQLDYPKHLPNTVVSGYSSAMHAKFELLNQVIRKNYFHTKYFMWLDIGLFRHRHDNTKFKLAIPTDFDDTKVAYSKVDDFKKDVTYKDIIYENMVWVGGASNLGKYDVLYKFTQEYLNFVNKSLSIKLISTDQQIIYGMYVDKHKPETKLQLYESGWFKLGYVCYAAGNN